MHEVQTAPEMGWGDLDDGPLLDAMVGRFDVLVTVDKSLPNNNGLTIGLSLLLFFGPRRTVWPIFFPLSRHFALQSKNFVQVRFANWLTNKALHTDAPKSGAPVSFDVRRTRDRERIDRRASNMMGST